MEDINNDIEVIKNYIDIIVVKEEKNHDLTKHSLDLLDAVEEIELYIDSLNKKIEESRNKSLLFDRLLQLIVNNGDCPSQLDLIDAGKANHEGVCLDYSDPSCAKCWIEALKNNSKGD